MLDVALEIHVSESRPFTAGTSPWGITAKIDTLTKASENAVNVRIIEATAFYPHVAVRAFERQRFYVSCFLREEIIRIVSDYDERRRNARPKLHGMEDSSCVIFVSDVRANRA